MKETLRLIHHPTYRVNGVLVPPWEEIRVEEYREPLP